MPGRLPLVTRGGKHGFVPDTPALSKSMEIATTSEGVEYLVAKLLKQLTNAKMVAPPKTTLKTWSDYVEHIRSQGSATAGEVLNRLLDYAEYVKLRENAKEQHWAGHFVEALLFQMFQADLAEKAFEKMVGEQAITMAIAISEAPDEPSKLLRGYSLSSGEDVDSKATDIVDTQFNRWLVLPENGMCSQRGVIYEADEKGQVKLEKGEPKRADPSVLKKKLMDPDTGFAKYVADEAKKRGKSLQITVREEPYPSTAAEKTQDLPETLASGSSADAGFAGGGGGAGH